MTKIFALSETTGKLEPCTMAVGILLDSGERVGHMADVDLFNAFNIDVHAALANINKREGTTYDCGEPGAMLWRCNRRKRIGKGKRLAARKRHDHEAHAKRVDYYRERVKNGLGVFAD